ncbi:MAG: TRAP transporter substrate-binding protein [Woeseiaceae bacterium]
MTGAASTKTPVSSPTGCLLLRLVASALLLCLTAYTHSAESIQLILNQVAPPNHFYHKDILVPWAQDVERVTAGRVTIKFSIAPMGSYRRNFDMVRAGMIDIAGGNQSATPGRFVVTQVNESPFHGGESVEAISLALWNTQQKYLHAANEFSGTELLALHASGTMFLYTTNRPVKHVNDIRGLKIAAPSDVGARVLTALHAVPVFLTAPELRDSLSRGIIDGLLMSFTGITRLGLQPYVSFQTPIANGKGLSFGGFFLAANTDSWARISEEDRDAIRRISGEHYVRRAGRVFDRETVTAAAEIRDSEIELVEVNDNFDADLAKAIAFMDREWIMNANDLNVDAEEALDFFREEVIRQKDALESKNVEPND